MLCFSTWITLLILIGSAWSQTPGTEPSARSLKFGGALLKPVQFCDTFCKNQSRLWFIRNFSCFVNCPELWRPPATIRPIPPPTPAQNATNSTIIIYYTVNNGAMNGTNNGTNNGTMNATMNATMTGTNNGTMNGTIPT